MQHLVFWVLSFYVLLRLFATDSVVRPIDYIYDGLFHLTILPAVYFNLYFLIPRLLDNARYLWYVATTALTIVVFSQLNIWFFGYLVDFLLPNFYFISYYELADIIQFFAVYLAATTLLKLSKGWFQLSEARTRLAETKQEKLDAELKALKSQINPHFLFNSLNNLYALSSKNDSKAPVSILKLSEVMRYMIYDAQEEKVALTREIEFIENYINLQKLRSDARADITFRVLGLPDGLKIAPLLFIPFVENSFKHGVKGSTGDSFVDIAVSVSGASLTFLVKNNRGEIDEVEKKKYGGIGLANVRKRLELIYPDKHTLEINSTDETFEVELTLELDEN